MKNVKLTLLLVVAVLFAVGIIQNTEVVAVNFLFWEFRMSRIILLLISLAVGFGAGFATAKLMGRKQKQQEDKPGAATG